MGEGTGVDDDADGLLTGLVDPVDDLVFAVRLVEADLEVELLAQRPAGILDIGQRLRAVDVRLALAEQVQVRAVEDIDEAGQGSSLARAIAASFRP
jgi:hypothetical protein